MGGGWVASKIGASLWGDPNSMRFNVIALGLIIPMILVLHTKPPGTEPASPGVAIRFLHLLLPMTATRDL